MAQGLLEVLRNVVVAVAGLAILAWLIWGLVGDTENVVLDNTEVDDSIFSYGEDELVGEKPEIPKGHQIAIDGLKKTMEEMKGSSATQCFANYGGLPELGEEGTGLSLVSIDDGTRVVVTGGKGGNQEVAWFELEDLKPCVVAGPTAQFFYEDFLKLGGTYDGKDTNRYFTGVAAITIRSDGDNTIYYGQGEDAVEFNDNGWLFKADDGRVCFLPTKSETFGDCDGDGLLDEECLNGEDAVESLPNKVGKGQLPHCFDKGKYDWVEVEYTKSTVPRVVVQKCYSGGCSTFKNRCDNTFENADVGDNCRLLITSEDQGCGYVAITDGSSMDFFESDLERDLQFLGEGTLFKSDNTRTSVIDEKLTCKSGVWHSE